MSYEKMLEACCSDEEWRPHMHHPFAWGDWTVATDGCVMVAIPTKLVGEEPAPTPGRLQDNDAASSTLGNLLSEPGEGTTFPLAALREWLGVPDPPCTICDGDPEETTCDACEESGTVGVECEHCHEHHWCICRDCDGRGVVTCPECEGDGICPRRHIRDQDRVTFDHHVLNRRHMARLLEHATGEDVLVQPHERWTGAIRVEGETWKGAVMPLRDTEGKRPAGDLTDALEPAKA